MSDAIQIPHCVARFLHDRKLIRPSNNTVKHTAFLDKRPGSDTSVDGHQTLCTDIHWDIGRKINPQRPLIGAADLSSDSVAAIGLLVVPDPEPKSDFPSHAELKGWPSDDLARRKIAQQLATASCFIPAP